MCVFDFYIEIEKLKDIKSTNFFKLNLLAIYNKLDNYVYMNRKNHIDIKLFELQDILNNYINNIDNLGVTIQRLIDNEADENVIKVFK